MRGIMLVHRSSLARMRSAAQRCMANSRPPGRSLALCERLIVESPRSDARMVIRLTVASTKVG